jgi:hypothetical protein
VTEPAPPPFPIEWEPAPRPFSLEPSPPPFLPPAVLPPLPSVRARALGPGVSKDSQGIDLGGNTVRF